MYKYDLSFQTVSHSHVLGKGGVKSNSRKRKHLGFFTFTDFVNPENFLKNTFFKQCSYKRPSFAYFTHFLWFFREKIPAHLLTFLYKSFIYGCENCSRKNEPFNRENALNAVQIVLLKLSTFLSFNLMSFWVYVIYTIIKNAGQN